MEFTFLLDLMDTSQRPLIQSYLLLMSLIAC